MKIYFPDDPIKQEMLEALIEEYKMLNNIYESGILLAGTDAKTIYEEILKSKKQAIEHATGLKIEEVLK